MSAEAPKKPGTYEIGYGKPPDATKFGNRPQPDRSVKASSAPAQQGIAALLDRPALVERGGRRAHVHPHEATMTSLANAVLKKNKISAAKKFLQECHKAGLLEPEPGERTSGVLVMPDYDKYPVFDLLITRVGLPPWDKKIIARAEAEYARDLQILLELKKQQSEEDTNEQ